MGLKTASSFGRTRAFRIFVSLACALSGLVLTGCPDNAGTQGTSATGLSTGASAGSTNPFNRGGSTGGDTPGSDGTASFITLTKVVRSNIDPNSELELIGQNSEIGTNCPDNNSCSCVFNWTESTGAALQREVPLDYEETNLARCPFTAVSSDAGYFTVRLKILSGSILSNSMQVYMPSLNPGLDTSIAANYLPVQRYMCRDMIDKAANTNYYTGLIDPRLWDLSYAYNFYTTSLGQDYGALALDTGNGNVKQVPNWECPPIPNDQSSDKAYDYTLYSLSDVDVHNPQNLTIADGLGDNTIFPSNDNLNLPTQYCPTGNEATCEKYILNRHDYYLATFKSSVFKQPVCVIHKVANRALNSIDCTGVDAATGTVTLDQFVGKKDVIGWAAFPDQNERCPDSTVVQLPTGKKWAKLWQFTAQLDRRSVPDITDKSVVGDLFCTTREDACSAGSSRAPAAWPTGTKIDGPSGYPSINAGALWIGTVCYNTRSPTGTGMPFQLEPKLQSNPTAPGMGNCDEFGKAGDGNGPGIAPDPAVNASYLNCTGGAYPSNTGDGGCAQEDCLQPAPNGGYLSICCNDNGVTQLDSSGNLSTNTAQKPANFTATGGQYCTPSLIGLHDASSAQVTANAPAGLLTKSIGTHPGGQSAPIGQDVWLLGNGSNGACIEADTDANGALDPLFVQRFPPSPNPLGAPGSKVLDADSPTDIVYVVTPASVTLAQMQDIENGPIARKYTPFRLPQGADASGRIIYHLTAGSSNTTDPAARLAQYPLCVVQDAKAGVGVINGGSP